MGTETLRIGTRGSALALAQAYETRARLMDQAATDKMRIVGFHLPGGGMGRVERKDGAYRFVEDEA